MTSRRLPLAAWAALQCATLAAAAGGVRLWAHHPDPPESLALAELTAVQLAAAATLFPVLFADGATTVIALALVPAFNASAVMLGDASPIALARTTGLAWLWMAGLAGWARWRKRPYVIAYLTVVAVELTIGGPLLFYSRCEAAAGAELPLPDPTHFGPLMAGVCSSLGQTLPWTAWWVTAGPVLSTAVVTSVAFGLRARRKLGSNAAPIG